MSYILEALKKAQAERQLGNAPTIHAPQAAQLEQPGAAASRKPLFIGLGAGALVVLLGGLFMWQRTPVPAGPAAASTAAPVVPAAAPTSTPLASTAAPAAAAPAVPAAPERAPAAPATAANAASNTLEVSAPPAPPSRPAHVAESSARTAPSPAAGSRAGAEVSASTIAARSPAVAPAVPPTPVAAAPRPGAAPSPSPEDSLPYLHQLPDNMQREVPRVSFGGYMYSANPADRLLLVDKTLRHEGEEVAPGLVLEKLLPKAAVMNYRGVRYRVAY
jgi:general secretion pathway protein B